MNSQGEELGGTSPPKRHLELEKMQYSLEHFKMERVGFEQYSSFSLAAAL
jgi:hypothetical protein